MEPASQKAKVIVTPEGGAESVIELGERLTIGRSTGNQLVVDDNNASRRHAEIRHVAGSRYRLFDVGSANGTWLNGRRLTAPKDLEDGDQIVIGNVMMRYVGTDAISSGEHATTNTSLFSTSLAMRNEIALILVSDIRNFTGMSEVLPAQEFSRLISDWFRESSEIVERHQGTVDKFIGDAVMVYWLIPNPSDPSKEVGASLDAARDLIERAGQFSIRLSSQFQGHKFRIGVGINMGEAIFGNIGTGANQSFTIVGDSVNVAFRLEALSKEKGFPVIVSRYVTDHAGNGFQFRDLGEVEVKGRKEPVSIKALKLDPETNF